MHDAFRVRLKLTGWPDYLPPVEMDSSGRVPVMGEVIDVRVGGRTVRARVTNIHSPASRTGAGVVHDVYADEIT